MGRRPPERLRNTVTTVEAVRHFRLHEDGRRYISSSVQGFGHMSLNFPTSLISDDNSKGLTD